MRDNKVRTGTDKNQAGAINLKATRHQIKKKGVFSKMAIGVLSLAIGVLFFCVSCAGISQVEPERKEQKKAVYPYPKEIA